MIEEKDYKKEDAQAFNAYLRRLRTKVAEGKGQDLQRLIDEHEQFIGKVPTDARAAAAKAIASGCKLRVAATPQTARDLVDLICPEHDRTSCSDEKHAKGHGNGFGTRAGNTWHGRCTRCMYLDILNGDIPDSVAQFNHWAGNLVQEMQG